MKNAIYFNKTIILNNFLVVLILLSTKMIWALDYITDIDKIQQDLRLAPFIKIKTQITIDNQLVNLNPFNSLIGAPALWTFSTLQFNDNGPLQYTKKEVSSVFVSHRSLNTTIPIKVFSNAVLYDVEIQNQLFDNVIFYSCQTNRCKVTQDTPLGKAHYEVIYVYLNKSQLQRFYIPRELVPIEDWANLKYVIVQYAFNWNDFFNSGLNLILISENSQQTAKINAIQIILLTPHFLGNGLYKSFISKTIDGHMQSLVKYLEGISGDVH